MGAGILDTLFLAGLTARMEAGRLVVSPADRITPALRQMIQTSKEAILAAIQDPERRRRWQVTDPGGKCWSVSCCPPATAGELAATWPAGTALEPVPDTPTQPDSPALDGATEAKIRAWLGHIGEHDARIISEVLERCRHEPDALEMYLSLAAEVPVENSSRNDKSCGTCLNYQRGAHPHLGTCRVGEPAPTCGQFWDSDVRSCEQWEAKP